MQVELQKIIIGQHDVIERGELRIRVAREIMGATQMVSVPAVSQMPMAAPR